ncbi:hypothetical protein GCM10019059_34210 [Camelimonas fluminis]|nr:hypothetical protein GCM10019059_34210 [Camelimonas fluminis]
MSTPGIAAALARGPAVTLVPECGVVLSDAGRIAPRRLTGPGRANPRRLMDVIGRQGGVTVRRDRLPPRRPARAAILCAAIFRNCYGNGARAIGACIVHRRHCSILHRSGRAS